MEYRDTVYFAFKRLRVAKLRFCKELTKSLRISRLFGFTETRRASCPWQSIETAPRDGSIILIDIGGTERPTLARWVGGKSFPWQFVDEAASGLIINTCKEQIIRAWMPVPKRAAPRLRPSTPWPEPGKPRLHSASSGTTIR